MHLSKLQSLNVMCDRGVKNLFEAVAVAVLSKIIEKNQEQRIMTAPREI